ncbi:aminotransferase class I/II-fold pyridoxal phosphate-dependent enzyme [Sporosarcina sp. BI001-red]|uniref:aminotransferase class I/II-fold pyridoxal phosphate-dependent enzyme n=1 Tax=Sporosarcina sp. BI001-red TaxID=2282866 RepID=UPI000E283FD5|nr:aminotransferase class I/II-fold pyridoxal phosphate-dependent enzyme [Sporosarcina sp. BI001-red]REB11457.1 aminotransferase class I/II-fold pyridoxal phosphate-dependent enzyme [Sporosarcina sp. BI001-red]
MDHTKRPVVEALQTFLAARPVSFHVPGHKHGLLSRLPQDLKAALRYDVTELTGLDDLHAPTEMLAEAQTMLADVYGADRSFFLVNGSTVGNIAMIRTVCAPGDTLLVQRNAHKSVFHALELAAVQAVLLTPEWDEATCTAGAVSSATVEEALERYPDAKGVVVTYPTYYGTTGSDLPMIVEKVHKRGIPVLVDEAHGAHFVAGTPFPTSALRLGADIVVQSAHKTLSAMTQASFLHVNSQLIDIERLARILSMLQTSSPSYVLLASLDDARAMIATYSADDKQAFLIWRGEFIDQLRKIKALEVIETEDPLKILIRQQEASGYTLQHSLEEKGIYTELADERQVLLVLPLLTEGTSYPTQSICEAVESAVQLLKRDSVRVPLKDETNEEEPRELIITTSSLSKKNTDWVSAESASGYQAAAAIIPYPPGIPLVLSGEQLNLQQIQEVCEMMESGAKFQGSVRANGPTVEFEVLRAQGEDGND